MQLLPHTAAYLARRSGATNFSPADLAAPQVNIAYGSYYLRYLIDHEGKAVSRKEMLERVWGLREDTDTRAIDNFIVRLRRYIEDEPARPKHLLTVRSVGYRFVAEP